MNFLKFIRYLADRFSSLSKPEVPTYNGTFKPVAILDVTDAPVVRLKDHTGQIMATTDIQATPFKDTLQDWTGTYSLVFPDKQMWEWFWMKFKDVI